MKIEIIDNVLPQEQADWVEGIFTEKDPSGNSMGWQYLNGSSGKEIERKFPSFVKPIYHCQSCGICRIGNSQFYRHCEKCNMCIPTRRNISNRNRYGGAVW